MQLPDKVNRLLFSDLGAFYEQHPDDAKHNLFANEHEIKRYLGTYFPRSFQEGYGTMLCLLDSSAIKEVLQNKETIDILDIGSGAGGYTLGVIWAISEELANKEIRILAIDGNKQALDKMKQIFATLKQKVYLKAELIHLNPKLDFSGQLKSSFHMFDIVLSSKFINEFFKNPANVLENLYYKYFKMAEIRASNESLAILNDLTYPVEINDKKYFIPSMINNEIFKFLAEGPDFGLIIPLSCARWLSKCNSRNACFSQRTFYVSHTKKHNDVSRTTTRVLANVELANKVLDGVSKQSCFRVGSTKQYCIDGNYYICDKPPMACYDPFTFN